MSTGSEKLLYDVMWWISHLPAWRFVAHGNIQTPWMNCLYLLLHAFLFLLVIQRIFRVMGSLNTFISFFFHYFAMTFYDESLGSSCQPTDKVAMEMWRTRIHLLGIIVYCFEYGIKRWASPRYSLRCTAIVFFVQRKNIEIKHTTILFAIKIVE